VIWLFVSAALLAPVWAPARAQDAQPSATQLLDDFRHYVITRQDELAEASAAALLARALSPEEFVGLVQDSRFGEEGFEETIRRALFVPSVEGVAAQLDQLYQQGLRDKARNPDEIARNISLLGVNQRGRILATQRLRSAGEYAVPQLVQVLVARRDPAMEAEAERVLIALGADAVAPISAAILKVDPVTQARLALILGMTRHPAGLAPLYELAATTDDAAVRSAAVRAVERISGEFREGLSPADLYRLLADDYFNESPSLTRFPGESHQLLWNYDPALGLYPTPIRTEVFHEARAMALAEKALSLNPDDRSAVALWIAANFKREIDTPEGYDNPVYSPSRRGALYYAVAAGPAMTQDVLGRALRDRDTPLARRAIEALRVTAGGAGIWSGATRSRPLVDALSYPDRRVQYEAALAVGEANPVEPFEGAERVTPLLASAIRDAGRRFAVVIARDPAVQQAWAARLTRAGFEALAPAATLEAAASVIAEAPGVDMLVVQGSGPDVQRLIESARADARLSAVPILGVMPVSAWNETRFAYQNDPLTQTRREGLSDDQFVESVEALSLAASGPPITEEEARRYASESLAVLRDLAVSGSSSLSIADAATRLISALTGAEGEVRLRVADVLARVGQRRAQVALADVALDAADDEQVALLEAVTRSVKTFGNLLEDRQVRRALALAESPDQRVATAAVALVGALNLEAGEIRDLILAVR